MLVCIPGYYKALKNESEENKKLRESLQDETIYVPETGTKLTIDEAERGYFIAHDNKQRIKTEAELEQNYSPEQAQAEKIRNYLLECQYAFLTDEVEDRLIEAVSNCDFISKYSDVNIYFTCRINEVSFLIVLLVDYQISNGKYFNEYAEFHILAAIHYQNISTSSHLAEQPEKGVQKALKALNAEYTREISGEYLIMKLYRHATLEDAQQMVDILKSVTANTKLSGK
jgi:hypothetical protein